MNMYIQQKSSHLQMPFFQQNVLLFENIKRLLKTQQISQTFVKQKWNNESEKSVGSISIFFFVLFLLLSCLRGHMIVHAMNVMLLVLHVHFLPTLRINYITLNNLSFLSHDQKLFLFSDEDSRALSLDVYFQWINMRA